MPYITREDGEHFVIPSYRDVLSAKQKSLLKKDILTLSQSYGEYITLQKKGPSQYEVAFSPDTGYLLGESIWQHFKRPLDMIYCEAIPNTTEAILVIVKSGSVYLDGSFPVESIPEELVIFLTQQNNFEIYLYGDVPISQTPETGKFSFEANSVKSFTILDKPVFPTLALMKVYQLQLVDQVLKAHGIGIFPTRKLLLFIAIAGLAWMGWSYLTSKKPVVHEEAPQVNPYQGYYTDLNSPAPDVEMVQLMDKVKSLFSMPGWIVTHIAYQKGSITATVQSAGSSTEALFQWAQNNGVSISIQQDGVYVSMGLNLQNRSLPQQIFPLKQIIGTVIDRVATIYPGNNYRLSEISHKDVYNDTVITISVTDASPVLMNLIGQQLKDLPLVLQSVVVDVDKGSLTGTINVEALGS
jgi:hypothetical protein